MDRSRAGGRETSERTVDEFWQGIRRQRLRLHPTKGAMAFVWF